MNLNCRIMLNQDSSVFSVVAVDAKIPHLLDVQI